MKPSIFKVVVPFIFLFAHLFVCRTKFLRELFVLLFQSSKTNLQMFWWSWKARISSFSMSALNWNFKKHGVIKPKIKWYLEIFFFDTPYHTWYLIMNLISGWNHKLCFQQYGDKLVQSNIKGFLVSYLDLFEMHQDMTGLETGYIM